MPDLEDGQTVEVQGSAARPYLLSNHGGVYACTCPAWRNQSHAIERRTCKHLRALRGDEAETARVGTALAAPRPATASGAEAPPLLLAERWDNETDLSGWWMSEKLDGVRAYWDGERFISRLGNPFFAPSWFVDGLPRDATLDGELWAGRKRFQRAVSIVRRQDGGDPWKEIRFRVFDAPGLDAPFEERFEFCKTAVGTDYAEVLEHLICESLEHLRGELDRVEALGGEGLMLRKPGSLYVAGRSSTLLKVKRFLDTEGRVVQHLAGAGRHRGRLGALLVEMADGTRVSVGTGFTDAEREAPPPPGSVITFRYQELSDGGVPRFPSYVGVRDDVRLEAAPAQPTGTVRVTSPKASSANAPPNPPAADAAPTPTAGGPNAVPASQAGQTSSGTARRFELSDGTTHKFWEVSVNGAHLQVAFGRIGTQGQRQDKSFPDADAASREGSRLVTEKLRKGYREV